VVQRTFIPALDRRPTGFPLKFPEQGGHVSVRNETARVSLRKAFFDLGDPAALLGQIAVDGLGDDKIPRAGLRPSDGVDFLERLVEDADRKISSRHGFLPRDPNVIFCNRK
jgi:hypothetical protein